MRTGYKVVLLTLLILKVRKEQKHSNTKPTIVSKYSNTLVLSSGGLMGVAWHLATLKRLASEGVIDISEFDLRIGTSAGGIAVLALGSDISIDELIEEFKDSSKINNLIIDKKGYLFKKFSWSSVPQFVSGVKLPYLPLFLSSLLKDGEVELYDVEEKINTLLKDKWPTNETWVVSAASNTNERVVLNSSSGVTPGFAASATAALPSLFFPKLYKEKLLVDGGILSATHLDLALAATKQKMLVLTTREGFVNPFKARSWIKFINLIKENFDEASLQNIKFKAKLQKVKMEIYRPRKEEREIFNSSKLFDNSQILPLIKSALS
jgi:predicted acylesterase/phospholipase RssA